VIGNFLNDVNGGGLNETFSKKLPGRAAGGALALVGALARSASENVLDRRTNLIYSAASAECLRVRSGCFNNLASSGESAAIFLLSVTGSVTIERTFFLSCSACRRMASNCSGALGDFMNFFAILHSPRYH
jgi:hypothetical protein